VFFLQNISWLSVYQPIKSTDVKDDLIFKKIKQLCGSLPLARNNCSSLSLTYFHSLSLDPFFARCLLLSLLLPGLISQNHSTLRFMVGSCRHCKLHKFVNVFTPVARPSTSATCSVLASVAPKCIWQPGSARTRWGELIQPTSRPPSWIWGNDAARGGYAEEGKGKDGWGKGQVGRGKHQARRGVLSRGRDREGIMTRLTVHQCWQVCILVTDVIILTTVST